jgi:DNA-directed RNA polymerase subunit M/transcription elongation factor TFIIS
MTSQQRKIVKNAINKNFDSSLANEFDRVLMIGCKQLIKNGYEDSLEDLYSKFAYEKLGELMLNPDKKADILMDIKNCNVSWKSTSFESYQKAEQQVVQQRIAGVKVSKGEFRCRIKTCGSDECIYYPIQTRSCDEGTTNYIVCSKCGERFTLN